MFKSILFTTAALGVLSACSNTNQLEVAAENDWCISGGTIYTADDNKPIVEAVAVKNGKIVYAGENVGDWCNPTDFNNLREINLDGSVMYPGLTDAHGHLLGIGLREVTLNLEGVKSIKHLKEKVAEAVKTTPIG